MVLVPTATESLSEFLMWFHMYSTAFLFCVNQTLGHLSLGALPLSR